MKWKFFLFIYTSLLFLIFISAYLGLIPTEIKNIPFYDSIGHFALYGILGYLSGKVFTKVFKIWVLKIHISIVLVAIIAILEECLQLLSPLRTFSIFDLGWGLLGIFIASIALSQNYDDLSKSGSGEENNLSSSNKKSNMKNINLEKIRTLVFIIILILSVIGSLVGIFAYSDDVGDAPKYYSIIDLSFSIIGLGLVFFIQKSKFIKNLFTVFIIFLFIKSIILGSFYGKFNFLLYEVPFYSGLIYYLSDPVTREKQNISLALLLVSVILFIFQIVLSF